LLAAGNLPQPQVADGLLLVPVFDLIFRRQGPPRIPRSLLGTGAGEQAPVRGQDAAGDFLVLGGREGAQQAAGGGVPEVDTGWVRPGPAHDQLAISGVADPGHEARLRAPRRRLGPLLARGYVEEADGAAEGAGQRRSIGGDGCLARGAETP